MRSGAACGATRMPFSWRAYRNTVLRRVAGVGVSAASPSVDHPANAGTHKPVVMLLQRSISHAAISHGSRRMGPCVCGTTVRDFASRKTPFAISRHVRPRFASKLPHPLKQRAQGKPDARYTRSLACKSRKTHTSISPRSHRSQSGIPCAMVLTAYIVLSPAIGLSCHRHRESLTADLTPASRRQDHTTSPSASVPFVHSTSASTASHPAFVTIASRPSVGTGPNRSIPASTEASSENSEIPK